MAYFEYYREHRRVLRTAAAADSGLDPGSDSGFAPMELLIGFQFVVVVTAAYLLTQRVLLLVADCLLTRIVHHPAAYSAVLVGLRTILRPVAAEWCLPLIMRSPRFDWV